MRKRLTDATSYCERIDCLAGRPGSSLCAAGTCYPRELYERLRYYEELEDAGRYIVLAEPERAGVDRLRELAEADLAGHAEIVVHCYACEYYRPINRDCGVCDLMEGMFRPTVDGYCSRGVQKAQDIDGKEDKADAHPSETWFQRLKKALPECEPASIVSPHCPGDFFSDGPGRETCPEPDMNCAECWSKETQG